MYQYFKETLEEAIRNSHSNDRAKYNFKKELQNILGQQYNGTVEELFEATYDVAFYKGWLEAGH